MKKNKPLRDAKGELIFRPGVHGTLLKNLNSLDADFIFVKNDGEPGGGPFWVDEKNGTQTLQIVESSHVDKSDPRLAAIWSQARYFNPVDMVCCIKNYHGEKFILDNYVDKNAYLISTKNEKGVKFKALELPGLRNGSMAYRNTIFVEMPLMVFNPVKTVDDLLRPVHRKTC
ncbi:MAG: DUF4301 family protein [Smithella sp.]